MAMQPLAQLDGQQPPIAMLRDLRPDLNERLQILETDAAQLIETRQQIDEQIGLLRQTVDTISAMIQVENRRLGEPEPQRAAPEDARLTGMRLADIAAEFLDQRRSKKDMLETLERIGYPFNSDNPSRYKIAVTMGWTNARKRRGRL